MDWKVRITLRISLLMLRVVWGDNPPIGVFLLTKEIQQEIENAPTLS